MQTEGHTIAHVVTRVVGINITQEPFEIEVSIRQGIRSEPVVHQEIPLASRAGRKDSDYTNAFTTNLSEANKAGLNNLAYWSTGRSRSTDYLINQALAHYLARFEGSRHSERLRRFR